MKKDFLLWRNLGAYTEASKPTVTTQYQESQNSIEHLI